MSDCKDPIIGAWVANPTDPVTGEVFDHGNYTYNLGGTYYSALARDIQQSVPPVAPYGAYATHSSGTWIKTGKRKYRTVTARFLNLKDLTPGNNYVGIPSFWILATENIKLSSDKQHYMSTGIAQFFAPDDLQFTTPLNSTSYNVRAFRVKNK
jgi:hypothetical protein